MKNLLTFLTALIALLLSVNAVAAADIIVTNADSVIGISRTPTSPDTLDSLEATPQGYSDIYLGSEDSTQVLGRELPTVDALDSLEALPQGYSNIYLGFADRIEKILLVCIFVCITDSDGDGVLDDADVCENTPVTEIGQIIMDPVSPWYGCGPSERDSDGDGFIDVTDNCPLVSNEDQADCDGDGIGNACDVDSVPPTTEISLSGTLGNNDWYTSDVQAVLVADDDACGDGVAATYYSLDLGDYLEGTSLTVTEEGGHTVSYYSVDVAGNEEEPKSVGFKIDKTPPEITINSPSVAEYEHSEIVEVDFTSVDDVSGVYRSTVFLDGQKYDPANPIDLLYLSLGTHTLRVESENYAGLVSTESVEFEVIATIDSLILIKDRLYEMGEIDNRGIATSLNKKLEAAKAKIDRGQNKPAKNILEAFINEVEAQRGKHITEFAADVLKTDAEYVIGQL